MIQLGVNLLRGAGRRRLHHSIDHRQHACALFLAELRRAHLVFLDGLPDHVTLRLGEPGRDPAQTVNRLVVERESNLYYTNPYYRIPPDNRANTRGEVSG